VTVIKTDEVGVIERGGGITTVPLVTPHSVERAKIVTGISIYPKGTGAPLHTHNCDEHVTLLEGLAEVEIGGKTTALEPYDSTYIRAETEHAFHNRGDGPMKILWVYTAEKVTRTFSATGETVEHLSSADLMAP
jgi:mannose-6-phosphate isomerase-like protein (cupin superfamily)